MAGTAQPHLTQRPEVAARVTEETPWPESQGLGRVCVGKARRADQDEGFRPGWGCPESAAAGDDWLGRQLRLRESAWPWNTRGWRWDGRGNSPRLTSAEKNTSARKNLTHSTEEAPPASPIEKPKSLAPEPGVAP